jgi:hypothetical protein
MDRSKDITGLRFTRWTVIRRAGNNSSGTALWLCRCSCGTERSIRGTELRYGQSTSCGCLMREISRDLCIRRNTTHGMTRSVEYRLWKAMIARCHSAQNSSYGFYGARGIQVCKRWRSSFINFYEDMGKRPTGATLDRTNNNGPYSPSNCRWATMREQSNNTRRNRILKFQGKSLTCAQWARELGITPMALWKRLNRGVPLSRALTAGVLRRGR